jgi:sugar phosphate isomerase/epimerase
MVQRAIQLYTLRDLDVPFTDLLRHAADAGFDGVEYAFRVGEANPEIINETLEEIGLSAPSAHVPFRMSISSGLVPIDGMGREAVIERYRKLGVERLVVPGVDTERFESVEAIENLADQLDTFATELAAHGFSLLYHNHDFEFVDVDGVAA